MVQSVLFSRCVHIFTTQSSSGPQSADDSNFNRKLPLERPKIGEDKVKESPPIAQTSDTIDRIDPNTSALIKHTIEGCNQWRRLYEDTQAALKCRTEELNHKTEEIAQQKEQTNVLVQNLQSEKLELLNKVNELKRIIIAHKCGKKKKGCQEKNTREKDDDETDNSRCKQNRSHATFPKIDATTAKNSDSTSSGD